MHIDPVLTQAAKSIIELLGESDRIKVYSYKDPENFSTLWELVSANPE